MVDRAIGSAQGMSGPFGIRVKVGRIRVWAGWGVQSYAFRNEVDAQMFIEENWAQFGRAWRRRSLSVGPLPPYTAINPNAMLFYGKEPENAGG